MSGAAWTGRGKRGPSPAAAVLDPEQCLRKRRNNKGWDEGPGLIEGRHRNKGSWSSDPQKRQSGEGEGRVGNPAWEKQGTEGTRLSATRADGTEWTVGTESRGRVGGSFRRQGRNGHSLISRGRREQAFQKG